MTVRNSKKGLIGSDQTARIEKTGFATERRGRDRATDAVGLIVTKVNPRLQPESAESSSPDQYPSSFYNNPVKQLDKYDLAGYSDVKARYPEVAEYISSLEEALRVASVARQMPQTRPTHKVSLSASGLAFADNRLYKVTSNLRLSIQLFPINVQINCLGRIISVNDAPEVGEGDKHTYRVIFTEIAENDRALIDQHVQTILRGFDRYEDVV